MASDAAPTRDLMLLLHGAPVCSRPEALRAGAQACRRAVSLGCVGRSVAVVRGGRGNRWQWMQHVLRVEAIVANIINEELVGWKVKNPAIIEIRMFRPQGCRQVMTNPPFGEGLDKSVGEYDERGLAQTVFNCQQMHTHERAGNKRI